MYVGTNSLENELQLYTTGALPVFCNYGEHKDIQLFTKVFSGYTCTVAVTVEIKD